MEWLIVMVKHFICNFSFKSMITPYLKMFQQQVCILDGPVIIGGFIEPCQAVRNDNNCLLTSIVAHLEPVDPTGN